MTAKNIYIISSLILGGLLFAFHSQAATLYLSTKTESVAIGDTIEVDVKIDSEDISFNAAQANIKFPPEILEISFLDRSKSVFNFWLEEPNFSNSNGSVGFIGGSTAGFSGKSLQILKIVFKVKEIGTANLIFAEGAITANDGGGTNILSEMRGIQISSIPKQQLIEISRPIQIIRPPAPSRNLPQRPDIKIPLYPDSQRWHNFTSPFFVQWELPPDVTGVSTALNQSPGFIPFRSEGLFESKQFPALEDSIWYIHVRFRNNVGWGPTAHYRVAIDTAPPLSFTVGIAGETASDNPQPTVIYQTGDALSGLDHYEVKINGKSTTTLHSFLTFDPLPPKKYLIRAKAADKAGNATESALEIEILPIASPVITSISKDVFVGEGGLEIAGNSLPNTFILLSVKSKSGQNILSTIINSDKNGDWSTKIDQPLKKGWYFIEVTAQDGRGALSLAVKSDLFKAKERPLFTIAGFGITQFWFFAGLIIILIAGFLAGMISHHFWRVRVSRRIVVAQRDILATFGLIRKDVDKMLSAYLDKTIEEHEKTEIEFLLKKIKSNLDKAEKYITENIEEIDD